MMLSSSFVTNAIIFVILGILLLARKRRHSHKFKNFALPPGPPGWPIIGNLFDLPKERAWTVYSDWTKKYGDVMFLRAFSTPMVVISSADAAFELMDKRSAIYSSKPASVIDKMTAWEYNLGLMPYGQRWRNVRRKIHSHFHRLATPKHHDKQTKHIRSFLRQCLAETGSQFNSSLIRHMLAATIMDVVYGIEVTSTNDELVKLVTESLEILGESRIPGKYWVDFIPFLQYVPRWVPGAASAKFAARSRPIIEESIDRPFDYVVNAKSPKDCIVLDLLATIALRSDDKERKKEEMHARHAAGVVYAAAAETTFSLLQTFLCGMAMNQAAQQIAREELGSVVDQDRLPTYEDQVSLPYIEAIFRECMRWMPVAPLGVPHSVTEDDFYDQYYIPSDAIIIPNIWHMLHDPVEYPDPDKFKPERFLKEGIIDPTVRDPTTIAFGFGRRICPGRHFARDSAFLTIASMLHVFEILPSVDENGNELDPSPQLEGSLIGFPVPVHYRLKVRSAAAKKLLEAMDV